MPPRLHRWLGLFLLCWWCGFSVGRGDDSQQPEEPDSDYLRGLQTAAMTHGKAAWGHWGGNPDIYSAWRTHSNRLIPVYSYGLSLESVQGKNSIYRDARRLKKLYGREPVETLNPQAEYFDQTDIHQLQLAAVAAGKKHVFLLVFDGMDWQTTWAASIYRQRAVAYREGPGTGLRFQDYRQKPGVPWSFGWYVTSPHNHQTAADVNAQTVLNVGGAVPGGFVARLGGQTPWALGTPNYLMGLLPERMHAVTDSAASATSLCAGIKTYNDAINVDATGKQVAPLTHALQKQGWGIGVVTSVPISHATPAAAYAQNVHRDDYQDLSRDLLGLPSVAHRQAPLPGVDVLIGAGWGEVRESDPTQGQDFVRGNRYLTDDDLAAVDHSHGGKYVVAQRTSGEVGVDVLTQAATQAAQERKRLLGFFGFASGHLPFQTADGKFNPTRGAKAAEQYTEADLQENPTLRDMTTAALRVLETHERFWLMVEAGDVDWANHDTNIDNSIGAVFSGDEAFHAITQWVEKNGGWGESALIVTADHGHFLVLDEPEALIPPVAE